MSEGEAIRQLIKILDAPKSPMREDAMPDTDIVSRLEFAGKLHPEETMDRIASRRSKDRAEAAAENTRLREANAGMAAVLVNIMTACRGDGIWVGRNDAGTVATIRDAAVGALVRACKADEGIMEADE
jgi:hypothetical protein